MCLDINFNQLKNVMKHLLLMKISVYDKHLAESDILDNAKKETYNPYSKNKKIVDWGKETKEYLQTNDGKKFLIVNRNKVDDVLNIWSKVKKNVKTDKLINKSFRQNMAVHLSSLE